MPLFPANATLKLYHVEFDGYDNIVDWGSKANRDSWFAEQSRIKHSWSNVNQIQAGGSITIDLPYTQATKCNYMVMDSPDYKLFYFIDQWAELSPAACAASIRLDCWTTAYGDFQFKHGRLVRGTITLANTNATFTPVNIQEYLAEPESMDTGDILSAVNTKQYDFTTLDANLIFVIASCNLYADWGDENTMTIKTSNNVPVEGMLAPEVLVFDMANFQTFAGELTNAPWIAQCIQGIYVVPKCLIAESCWTYRRTNHEWGASVLNSTFAPNTAISPTYDWYSKAVEYYTKCVGNIPVLTKIFTAPYTNITVSNNDGGYMVLEPQKLGYSTDDTATLPVHMKGITCFVPGSMGTLFYPAGYNAGDMKIQTPMHKYRVLIEGDKQAYTPYGDGMERGIYFGNFPSMVLPVDNQKLYYASTSASYNQTRNSIFEQLEFNNSQAQAAYRDSLYAIETQQNVFGVTNETQATKDVAYWNRAANLNSVYDNSLTGNIQQGSNVSGRSDIAIEAFNALGNFMSSIGVYDFLNQIQSIDTSYVDTQRINAINKEHDVEQAGRNLYLSSLSNAFSAEQSLKTLEAARKDSAKVAPGISGSLGGAWNFATGNFGLTFKLRMPSPKHMRDIVQYWLGYGYADDRQLKAADFNTFIFSKHICKYWDYWQFSDIEFHTDCPQSWADVIKGMFIHGVKVWKNPEEVGYKIERENVPDSTAALPRCMGGNI